MTSDKNLKKQNRAYASEHGVSYAAARRAVLRMRASADAMVPAPPTGPKGTSSGAVDDWFPRPPSDEQLIVPVLEDLFNRLLNEPIGAYGIPLPDGAPPLRDPRITLVEPLRETLEIDFVEDYDGDTMSNVVMRANVELTGELDPADGDTAEGDDTARLTDAEGDSAIEVTVVLTERPMLQIEAGILHESVAELADLQEVFSRTWVN